MSLTESEYDALTKRYSQNSKPWINVPKAFLIGGGICALGQGLIEGYTRLGLPADLASGACSMTLVVLSALVPITGFANAMVSPALEFKSEGLILGTGAKMFAIAGPVLVYGISASVLYGLIRFLFGQA